MIKGTIVACMKSVDMHSLQHLASLKVASLVCESEEVQNMLRGFRQTIDRNAKVVLVDSQWEELRDKVKRKLNQIGMPDLIIEIVLEHLWPIGFEVFKWIAHHAEDTGIECSSNYCWTPQFNIDYVKTAKNLVKNEAFDIKNRFKLACLYCFESEVRSLWEEMSLSERRCFFLRGNLKRPNQNSIVLYWSYYIQEVPINSWDSKVLNHKHLFIYAVQNGYLSATKFYLDKLKRNMRSRIILNGFTALLRDIYKPELKVKEQLTIACFLVCQTPTFTPPGVKKLILLYFLEWPMQKHFMTVVNRMRESRGGFPETCFVQLLEAIIEKDIKDFKDYNYKALFIELWYQFPEHQMYVGFHDSGFKILMKFVKKHLGFIFEEEASFEMKFHFRFVLFFQKALDDDTRDYDMGNVEFFKFLVQAGVAIKSVIEIISNQHNEFSGLPLEELLHLMDSILV